MEGFVTLLFIKVEGQNWQTGVMSMCTLKNYLFLKLKASMTS